MTDDAQPEVNIQDLIHNAIGEKPDDFATAFNDLMKARLAQAVDAKKVEMSATLFGSPEPEVDAAIQAAQDAVAVADHDAVDNGSQAVEPDDNEPGDKYSDHVKPEGEPKVTDTEDEDDGNQPA